MDELISKLTPEQALRVVYNLCEKGGDLRLAVLEEARNLLGGFDVEEIAEEVFFALDSLDVEDLWDRSGPRRDGYTAPEEAGFEMVEEELKSFSEQVIIYHELGMLSEEGTYCMGVILGFYRYEHESKSEFSKWAVDVPLECTGFLLDEWRKRCEDPSAGKEMDSFLAQSCPKWAGYLIRDQN